MRSPLPHPVAPLTVALALALAVALAPGCTATHGERAQERPQPAVRTLLAPVEQMPGPLALDDAEGEGLALDELVRRYEQATGRKVVVSEAFPGWAGKARMFAVGSASVPADAVQATFESLLDRMGCVLVRRGAELLLTVPDAETDGWLRSVALPIPIERVEDARAHAALLVSTVVELPSTDVLVTCSDLRGDEISAVGELVPLVDTSSVLVLGPGRRVARRVEMLRAVDAANAAAAAGRAR